MTKGNECELSSFSGFKVNTYGLQKAMEWYSESAPFWLNIFKENTDWLQKVMKSRHVSHVTDRDPRGEHLQTTERWKTIGINVTSWARTLTDCKMITSEPIDVSLMTTLYHGEEHSRSGVSNQQQPPLVCAIPASLWTLTTCRVIEITPCQRGAFQSLRNHLQAANTNENQIVRSYNDAVQRTLTGCRRVIINRYQLKVHSTVSRKTFTDYTATKIDRYQLQGYIASW